MPLMPASGQNAKTHAEHNRSAFSLIADVPCDMDFRRNVPEADTPTASDVAQVVPGPANPRSFPALSGMKSHRLAHNVALMAGMGRIGT